MTALRGLQFGLRSLLRRGQVDRELDDELRFHLEMETELNVRRGLSPEAARREALRTFGGVEKVREQCREQRPSRWLEDLGRDLRYGVRTLLRSPGYSAVVVATLALGIGARMVLRSTVPPASLEKSVRAAVLKVDPEQPLYDVQTLEQVRSLSLAPSRLTALLLGVFAALALVITATGIAGLLAFSVSRRSQEIGIRMALGAAPGDVLWMVLRQAAALVLTGLGLGVLGALVLTRLMTQTMSGLLFGIEPNDPATFLGVSLVLLTVAAVACWLPARRATGIHPMLALRKA